MSGMTRLQFCAKCDVRRLKDVKKRLQELFTSKEELEENVCGICGKQLNVEKTEEVKGTILQVEVKKEPADVASALEGGVNRGYDSNEETVEPIEVGQSSGTVEVTWQPGMAVDSYMEWLKPSTSNVDERGALLKTGVPTQSVTTIAQKKYEVDSDDDDSSQEEREDQEISEDLNAQGGDESCRTHMDIQPGNPCIYITSEKSVKQIDTVVEKESGTSKKDTPSRAHRELRALKREVLEVMGNSSDEERPYQCSFCDKKPFLSVIIFLRHVAKHTGTEPITEPFQCRKCNRSFGTVGQWFKHTNERLFKCTHPGCNDKFNSRSNLISHVKLHTETKRLPCEQCDHMFSTKSTLVKHIKVIHKGIKNYMCRFCGLRFECGSAVKRHELKHTNERPFKCDQCNKDYVTKYALQTHMMDHTGEKPYVCDLCGHATKWPSDLKRHMQTHTGEKPYQCEQCGNRFTHKNTLRLHKRTVHDKVKEKKCRYCDQIFRYEKTRSAHEKTHPEWTGVRKYLCEICGKDCQDGSTLEGHMNTHNNVKPYACEYCNYSTSWSRNLILHVKKHSGEKCYPCSYCGMRFISYEECKDHRKICRKTKGDI